MVARPPTLQNRSLHTVPADSDARDIAWLARIAEGDMLAFRALFDEYAPTLIRLASGYVRSADMAHDVVQEVFIAIWERRATLSTLDHPAGYLARATRNRAWKALRSAARAERWTIAAAQEQELLYPVVSNLGDQSLETEEFLVELRRALAALPPRQREVFLLHREQGLDYATIAAALGVTIPSVHNVMSRAIARLRDALSDRL
jgi:RNA polymerase sigma-70 factor (ECF subfamily)